MSKHEALTRYTRGGALVLAGLCLGGIVEGGINQMREEDRAEALVSTAHKAILTATERTGNISVMPYSPINIFDKDMVRSDGIVTNIEMEKDPDGKDFAVQPGIPLTYAIVDLRVGTDPQAPDCVLEDTHIDLATQQSSPEDAPSVYPTGYSYKRFEFGDIFELGNTLGVENGPNYIGRLCAMAARIQE